MQLYNLLEARNFECCPAYADWPRIVELFDDGVDFHWRVSRTQTAQAQRRACGWNLI